MLRLRALNSYIPHHVFLENSWLCSQSSLLSLYLLVWTYRACLFGLSCEEVELFSGKWNGRWSKRQKMCGFSTIWPKMCGFGFFLLFSLFPSSINPRFLFFTAAPSHLGCVRLHHPRNVRCCNLGAAFRALCKDFSPILPRNTLLEIGCICNFPV